MLVWARMRSPNGSIMDLPASEIKTRLVLSGSHQLKNLWEKTLTFPQLEPGCIVQYQFLQEKTMFANHIKYFQGRFPIVSCQYIMVSKNKSIWYESKPFRAIIYSAKNAEFDPQYSIHTWTARNVPAYVAEPLEPSADEALYQVTFGHLFTSESFEDFIYSLTGRTRSTVEIDSNVIINRAKAVLDSDLTLRVKGDRTLRGASAARFLQDSTLWQPQQLKEYMASNLKHTHPDLTMDSIRFDKSGPNRQSVVLTYDFSSVDYVQKLNDSTLLINPNVLWRDTLHLVFSAKTRLHPVMLGQPMKIVDSIYIEIPRGYRIKILPTDLELPSYLGKFSAKCYNLGDEVLLEKIYSLDKVYIIPRFYDSLRLFFADISKQESQTILLSKQN